MNESTHPATRPLPTFVDLFGRPSTARADAPGRVNVIGEHTDYNDGFVLPAAIAHRTTAEIAPREGEEVRAWSDAIPEAGSETYRLGDEARRGGWIDYVQGVTHVLRAMGHPVGGFDLRVGSTVPVGAGVSSSAALEISLLRALREAFSLPLDDVTLARVGQRAEHEIVGARVGIMDQMAACFADQETALFIDTRSLTFERVALPPTMAIAVVHSGISHEHAGGEYGRRREECEQAARLLGAATLREVPLEALRDVARLPAPLGARARHVLTENDRVLRTVAALRAGDVDTAGQLVNESHRSLRDDFEVSLPAIDQLVALAREHPDTVGARLTGGGFGGSIIILTRHARAADVARDVVRRAPPSMQPRPSVVQP